MFFFVPDRDLFYSFWLTLLIHVYIYTFVDTVELWLFLSALFSTSIFFPCLSCCSIRGRYPFCVPSSGLILKMPFQPICLATSPTEIYRDGDLVIFASSNDSVFIFLNWSGVPM